MATPDPFDAFVRKPSREAFLAVRKAVIADKSYSPYGRGLDDAAAMLEEGKHQEFLDAIPGFLPDHLLSPRLHIMASYAWRELGDEEAARFEMGLAHLCIEGILKSGDGSRAKPYLVLRVSDEYDVLGALKKQLSRQSLLKNEGRSIDAIECTDGSVVNFDVTDMFSRLNDTFRKPE